MCRLSNHLRSTGSLIRQETMVLDFSSTRGIRISHKVLTYLMPLFQPETSQNPIRLGQLMDSPSSLHTLSMPMVLGLSSNNLVFHTTTKKRNGYSDSSKRFPAAALAVSPGPKPER